MKCLSFLLSLLFQSSRSLDRSISSVVQKEAICCLYIDHRSGYFTGKREKREPCRSVEQISSGFSLVSSAGKLCCSVWAGVADAVMGWNKDDDSSGTGSDSDLRGRKYRYRNMIKSWDAYRCAYRANILFTFRAG